MTTWCERHPRRVLAVFAVVLAALIGPWWYATPDAAAYLSLARRLAHGEPPHAFGNAQPSFPLGYPLLISPAFWFGDRPFLLISFIHWMLAISFMVGTYRWLRRMAPEAAVLLTACVMANVNVWNMYRRTLSEVAFLPILVWTVNLASDALVARHRRGWRLAALAAGLVLLIAVRETGVIVAIAVGLTAVLTSRASPTRLPLVITGLVCALGGTLVLRRERLAAIANALRAALGDAPAAGTWLEMARRRVIEINQLSTPGMFNAYSDPPGWLDANLLVGTAVVTLLALGWTRLIRRHTDAFLIVGPLYFGVLTLWPYDGSTRYVLPLLPLACACGWEALSRLGPHRRALVAVLVVAHLVVATGYWLLVDRPRARHCNQAWEAIDATARTVAASPAPVAAQGLPSCVQLDLQVALDQIVVPTGERHPTAAEVGWVVTSREQPSPAGFSLAPLNGEYRLWRRNPLAER